MGKVVPEPGAWGPDSPELPFAQRHRHVYRYGTEANRYRGKCRGCYFSPNSWEQLEQYHFTPFHYFLRGGKEVDQLFKYV